MDENRIRLTINPSGGEDGPVLVSDFLKQVDSLRRLVGYASALDDADARIVGLSMNSPASIEMESWSPHAEQGICLAPFFHDIRSIVASAEAPKSFSREVFDTLKDLASVVGRGVNSVLIQSSSDEITIDLEARQRIEAVFGQDYSQEGTIDGMLEAVNIHGKANNCALYPVVGPTRVSCRFDDGLFSKIKPALGKYVLIEGMLKYRWREAFPHEGINQRDKGSAFLG